MPHLFLLGFHIMRGRGLGGDLYRNARMDLHKLRRFNLALIQYDELLLIDVSER